MSESYLAHYGIKGMKWGVRRDKRALRKEIVSRRRDLVRSEEERLRKEYDIEGKKTAAYEYGSEHGLDLDDGGGGDEKAGENYWNMWEEISELESAAYTKARQYAHEKLAGEFGEQTVSDALQQQAKIDGAEAFVAMSAMCMFPAALIVGLVKSTKN